MYDYPQAIQGTPYAVVHVHYYGAWQTGADFQTRSRREIGQAGYFFKAVQSTASRGIFV